MSDVLPAQILELDEQPNGSHHVSGNYGCIAEDLVLEFDDYFDVIKAINGEMECRAVYLRPSSDGITFDLGVAVYTADGSHVEDLERLTLRYTSVRELRDTCERAMTHMGGQHPVQPENDLST